MAATEDREDRILRAGFGAMAPKPEPEPEPEPDRDDVVRTPSGIISREEHERLQQEYPKGIPATAVERVVEEREKPLPFEVERAKRRHREDIAKITDLTRREDVKLYKTLTDKEQFNKAVELGLVEEGSKFVSAIKVDWSKSGLSAEEIERQKARITKLTGKRIGTWAFYTPEQVAEIATTKVKVKASKAEKAKIDAVLAKLKPYKTAKGYNLQRAFAEGKGADVYAARALNLFTPEQVAEAQFGDIGARGIARNIKKFEAANTKLPDGQWIDNKQLKELKTSSPEIHKALITRGFDAANKIITNQREALASLRGIAKKPPYTLVEPPKGPPVDLTNIINKKLSTWEKITPWKEELGETVFSSVRGAANSVYEVVKGIQASKEGRTLDYIKVQNMYNDILDDLDLSEKNFKAPSLIIHTGTKAGELGNYNRYWNRITIYLGSREAKSLKDTLTHETVHALTMGVTPTLFWATIPEERRATLPVTRELERVYFLQHINPNKETLRSELEYVATYYLPDVSLKEKVALFNTARARAKAAVGYTGYDSPAVVIAVVSNGVSKIATVQPPKAITVEPSETLIDKYEARTAGEVYAKALAEFEATNTQLPDGQWINKEELARAKLIAPIVHKALTDKGFDAANQIASTQQKTIETRKPTETFREQHIRLYGKEPSTIGAYEEREVSLADRFIGFFTGRGTGELATGTEFLKLSIPGFIGGMSGAQAQTQAETESLYRYLFKEEAGRFPTLGEMPDIKAGLPRGINVASVVPGVVTAYRWDTMPSEQKAHAIQADIAMAALYGMMAIGLTLKPGKVPIVKYKLVNEMGVPTGKTIKVPVYAPDTLGTKFAARNPALWQRGATPLKIYGETGIKPITPILSRELLLRGSQVPTLPLAFKGGVRTPSGLIPPTHIPATTYFPGASYTTARGIKINIPAGTIKTKGLIPSGMEIWSRKGLEQPWNPFAHTGARILTIPVTGELTIVDVATGRTRNIGLPSAGAGIAVGAAPREPSTLTMTPEQVAKLKPLITPTPYIEYEVTPSGLVAPRIVSYPKPRQVVSPSVSPMISPAGMPSPAVVPSPAVAPTPAVTPTPAVAVAAAISPAVTPTPAVAVSPVVAPSPAVAAKPAVAPARVPAAKPIVAPTVTPVAIPIPVSAVPILLSGKEMKGRALTEKERKSAVAWPQGFGWWVVFRRGGKRFRFFHHGQQPPQGIKQVRQGKGEAARGIQQHKGVAPVSFKLAMGAVDVSVESPSREPGKVGAIDFTPTGVSASKPRLTAARPSITPKRPRIT